MAKRLLIIEDEQYLRELYKELFETDGFFVDAAATGNEGLAALDKNSYDVIILDIILPDIHGLDILEKIKKEKKTATVPVILLTNLDQDFIIKKGKKLGAAAYLIKVSYTPEEIVDKIKEVLRKYE